MTYYILLPNGTRKPVVFDDILADKMRCGLEYLLTYEAALAMSKQDSPCALVVESSGVFVLWVELFDNVYRSVSIDSGKEVRYDKSWVDQEAEEPDHE